MPLACASGPREPPKLFGQTLVKPLAVWLRVSAQAAEQDDLGGASALIESLTGELKDKGIQSRLFASETDAPHTPRLEILIEGWDVGDRASRAGATGVVALGLPGAAAAAALQNGSYGHYSVVLSIYRQGDQQPAYQHRYAGTIFSSSETASTSIGESIASSIARVSLGGVVPYDGVVTQSWR